MLSWLRRTPPPIAAPTQPPPPADQADSIAELRRRVAALESERLDILTEWSKTRDQVLRYMKRVSQVRVREEAAAGDDPDGDAAFEQMDLEVLRQKFGGFNGRG